MGKRKTQEEFEKELKEKFPQIEVRGKYNGEKSHVDLYCTIHDYSWSPMVRNAFNGCPVCNGSKKCTKTFIEEMRKKYPQIKVCGEYKDSRTYIHVKCTNDDYEWDGLANNLLAYGCPVCNGAIITTQSFKNEMQKLHPTIDVLEEWTGIKNPIECHCNKCDLIWAYNPRTLKDKGCPKCNNSKTRNLTHSEYVEKINKLFDGNIIVLGKYKNSSTNIEHKCIKHNVVFQSKPPKILNGHGCKFCGYEVTSKKRTKSLDVFLKQLNDIRGNEYSYIDGYVNSSTNATFRHHMIDGTYHDFKMTPNSMISSRYNCPCCSGYQVSIGYNDLNTVRPDLSILLKNYEDGYKYTEWSGEKLDWICPNCGNEINKRIAYVSKDGLSCNRCSDGISYPNKLIYNSLAQISNIFQVLKREYRPDWCHFKYQEKDCYGIYDVYFELDNKKYIIEMDGGLGHGNRTYTNSKVDTEELIFKDKEKDRLAAEHNIIVIRIDSDYERQDKYYYILDNIFSSKLSEILDLSLIDFDKANIESQGSLMVNAIDLWNQGESVFNIANKIGVHECTVTSYLKAGKKYGMCDSYSVKESKYRSTSNDVVCLNTNKYFRSITDGAAYYNISPGDISKCCRRKATFGGWHNDEKLIWMYKKDYDNYSFEELKKYIPKEDDNYTKIICLNTGEIFDGIKFAAQKYNLKTGSSISACCTHKYNSAGVDENNIPLKWMYLSEYNTKTQDEINDILNYKSQGKQKHVICMNTLQIFNNSVLASEWCGLQNKLPIQRCCRGECINAGLHPETKKPLKWMYYKDYIKEFGEVA